MVDVLIGVAIVAVVAGLFVTFAKNKRSRGSSGRVGTGHHTPGTGSGDSGDIEI